MGSGDPALSQEAEVWLRFHFHPIVTVSSVPHLCDEEGGLWEPSSEHRGSVAFPSSLGLLVFLLYPLSLQIPFPTLADGRSQFFSCLVLAIS